MLRDEDYWLSVTDAFYAAAIGDNTWYSALDGLAQATDSTMGELIGLGARAAVPFNIITNVDPNFPREFAEIGGGDPSVNPRVKAGMAAPVLKVLAESDFMTPDEYKQNAHIQEVTRRWDIAHICLATLERKNGIVVGLAVGRTGRQGPITSRERSSFASLAPHVRAAVLAQIALEDQGAALIAASMEAVSIPAFVCDRLGRVRALSPSAERLVSAGHGLQLRQGELRAGSVPEAKALSEAIDRAARGLGKPGGPLHKTVMVRSADGDPLALDVIPLPQRLTHEFSFAPRVLVIARGMGALDAANARRSALLQAGYGLTASETDVALKLSSGMAPATIATRRSATLETVRTQIKAIRAKVRADGQADLIAKLNRL